MYYNEGFLKDLIYNKSKREVLNTLDEIEEAETIHIFMNNYNWDDGFEIPKKILSNTCCELSTALMIFYLADGIRFLEDKDNVKESYLVEWSSFLQELYNQIMSGKFKKGDILFKPPVSKVQAYKLKKMLNEDEEIFINEIGKINLNILL